MLFYMGYYVLSGYEKLNSLSIELYLKSFCGVEFPKKNVSVLSFLLRFYVSNKNSKMQQKCLDL